MKSPYKCSECNGVTFRLEDTKVFYRKDEVRMEPVLVCANEECKGKYRISPCNTNGLFLQKKSPTH